MQLSPSAFQARLAAEGLSPGERAERTPAAMAVAREASRVAEDIREEVAILRDCMLACGLLTQERLQAEAHRRHFQQLAQCSCGWSSELGASLEDLSRGPLTRVACFLGRKSGLQFRSISSAVEAACAKAASLYGPSFYVWGGFDGEKNLSSGEAFHPSRGEWEPLPALPQTLSGGACAAVAGKIYAAGGFNGKENKRSAYRIDPAVRKWEVLPPMSVPRFGTIAADFGGTFTVCGGNNGQTRLSSVESFLPDKGEWGCLPDMSVPRIGAVAASLAGKLFVAGGQDLRSAECFHQGQWVRIPNMLEKRFGAAGAACAGCVYACGGKGKNQPNLDSAERFDPAIGHWEALPLMVTRRFGGIAQSVQNKLYVFGGNDYGVLKFGGTRLKSVECFMPETGEWQEMPEMLEGRSGAFAAVVIQDAWMPEV